MFQPAGRPSRPCATSWAATPKNGGALVIRERMMDSHNIQMEIRKQRRLEQIILRITAGYEQLTAVCSCETDPRLSCTQLPKNGTMAWQSLTTTWHRRKLTSRDGHCLGNGQIPRTRLGSRRTRGGYCSMQERGDTSKRLPQGILVHLGCGPGRRHGHTSDLKPGSRS